MIRWLNPFQGVGQRARCGAAARQCDPAAGSATDLNHLAHALAAGGFPKEVAAVSQVIGDFTTPAPWQYITHDPDRWWEEFEAPRSACLRRIKPPPNAGRRP
ncbi:hypothetical protein LRS74_28110 [Streptomyces sp. LX-29]|uniref:hypothetical protein n=1 Tax=Streptomyces sp. LX-29 TaxID=2900152 RepID=UPI00240E8796|nr:hypothetical protein [Streptomyces sp. LX-29]WFB10469.1 hypothetical protein LRS74_28110 [Streptomyces sp. LX-29]